MADKRTMFTIRENDEIGNVKISEEVIAIIAGLAATEVEGVASMGDGITKDIVAKLGMKDLKRGVSITQDEEGTSVDLVLNIAYGKPIVSVSTKVQEKVKNAIEAMTGLNVKNVNVRVADVAVSK